MLDSHLVAGLESMVPGECEPRAIAGHVRVEHGDTAGSGCGRLNAANDGDHRPPLAARGADDRPALAITAPAAKNDAARRDPQPAFNLVGAGLEEHGTANSRCVGRPCGDMIDRPLNLRRVVAVDRRHDDGGRHDRRLHTAARVSGVRVVGHAIAARTDFILEPAFRAHVHVPVREIGGQRDRNPRHRPHENPCDRHRP